MENWASTMTVESVAWGGVRIFSAPFSVTYFKNLVGSWSAAPLGLYNVMTQKQAHCAVGSHELACLLACHKAIQDLTIAMEFTL